MRIRVTTTTKTMRTRFATPYLFAFETTLRNLYKHLECFDLKHQNGLSAGGQFAKSINKKALGAGCWEYRGGYKPKFVHLQKYYHGYGQRYYSSSDIVPDCVVDTNEPVTDQNDAKTDEPRNDQELEEQERPIYLNALSGFLKGIFIFYDALAFIPFKIFDDQVKKKERSQEQKAVPIDGNPASAWRHVDTIGKPLYTELFEGCPTLGAIWDKAAELYNGYTCMGTREVTSVSQEPQPDGKTYQKVVLGEYNWLNYEDVGNMVSEVISGLDSLGLQKGQHVVIYSETRMEWMISAIACFKLGLPIVTVYPTLGDEAIAYAMNECDGVLVFTSRALIQKVQQSIKNSEKIKRVVYFSEMHQLKPNSEKASADVKKSFQDIGVDLHSFEGLMQLGSGGRKEQTRDVKRGDLAMIMYTSGTTGNPKGVLLSHGNIISTISGQSAVISVDHNDTYIGYLPLAHIFEVCAELVCLFKGCKVGYSSPHTLYDRATKIKKGSKGDCGELKPTLIACVPAIMDKIFKTVTDDVKGRSPFQREIFRICYERKRSRYEEGHTSLVVNRLAFAGIRKILGGNLRFVLSGGAPLNPETQRFMNICFCCPVVQGYGLTETCGGATLADEHDLSTGFVGPPLRCCEIKLREWAEAGYTPSNSPPQGEILISGANVALGYYKNEAKTKEDFIELDGKRWFSTGDIGEFRNDGSLRIIDRKKNLVKLPHGEYISLGKVEEVLTLNPIVDNICVHADSLRDFVVALVVPNKKNLEALAKKHGITESNWDILTADKGLTVILQKELTDFVAGKLRSEEIPKKILICKEPWTLGSGLLSETLKVKRKEIEKTFKKEIESLYEPK